MTLLRAEAQAVVASWEALEDAVNHRNADGWAAHVADEFVFNVKEDGNPLTKADRVATIRKQAEGNTVTDIGTVIPGTMHVWVFGGTAVMSDQQQPTQGGNPYQAMRIWIKRDDRWQLMYSQQTVIENAGRHTKSILLRFIRPREQCCMRPTRKKTYPRALLHVGCGIRTGRSPLR